MFRSKSYTSVFCFMFFLITFYKKSSAAPFPDVEVSAPEFRSLPSEQHAQAEHELKQSKIHNNTVEFLHRMIEKVFDSPKINKTEESTLSHKERRSAEADYASYYYEDSDEDSDEESDEDSDEDSNEDSNEDSDESNNESNTESSDEPSNESSDKSSDASTAESNKFSQKAYPTFWIMDV